MSFPLRDDLLNYVEAKLIVEQIDRNDNGAMLRYLLGNTEIASVVAKYLRKTMKLRDFLIDNPKQLI